MTTMTRHIGWPLALAAVVGTGACTTETGCPGGWCGTAVVVTPAAADVLIPPLARGDVDIAIADLLFVRLADIAPDLGTVGDSGFRPMLAKSWTFESPTTLRFTLDSAARWQDGQPVTAADVAFTFDVYRDTLIGSQSRERLGHILAVEAPDPHTAVFRFDRPYAEEFFDAVYHMRILPKHILDSIPRARWAEIPFARHPVGDGPYRIVRWTAGESVELQADSTFFLGRPGLRRIVWRFTNDPAATLTQLTAGEADVTPVLGGPENAQRVRETEGLRVIEYPSTAYGYLAFNFRDPSQLDRPHPLFSDAAVRRALALGLDREAVVTALFGSLGRVPPGPITPAMWIWNDSVPQPPYDTAAARRLLASDGWRDRDGDGVLDRGGRRLAFELSVPTSSGLRRRGAQIIQEQWRRLGVAVEISELEFNTFLSRSQAGRFDALIGAYGNDPSPASIAEVWSSSAIGNMNWGAYRSAETDRLIARALAATSRSELRSRWLAVLAKLNKDVPAIWLYAPILNGGVQARFENAHFRPDQWAADLWTWRVDPRRLIGRDRIPD